MIILRPDISIYWCKGVRLTAFSYLYMDTHSEAELKTRTVSNSGDIAIPIGVTIDGEGLTIRDEHVLNHMPGVLPLLRDWIATHDLHRKWLEEQGTYDTLMNSVLLPGVDPIEQYRCMAFLVPVGGCGHYDLPPLRARVVVHVATMPGEPLLSATVYLYIATNEKDEYSGDVGLCHYPLALPITMDSLKESMRAPLLQYLSYL